MKIIIALAVLMTVCTAAFAEKTEAQFNAQIRQLEAEARQKYPDMQWVNGKLTEVTL